MIEATLGNPSEPGIYAARQWYCWRILEWHSGQWWYPGKVAQWPHKAEIEAHIGPLPVIAQDFSMKDDDLEKYSASAAALADDIDRRILEAEDWEKRLDWDGQAQYADDAAREYDL